MNADSKQALETEAWHYTRMMFARGHRGSLHLRKGRLAFVTLPDPSGGNSFYEKVDTVAQTLFELPVEAIDQISYNWLLGAMTLTEHGQRHFVSFAGPPSGNHFQDARRLVTALTALGRWRTVLEPKTAAPATPPRATTSATHRRTTPQGAQES